MELVYLWVEDYKNIYREGFNFSPNFECEFFPIYEKYRDENGEEKEKLQDNCELKITPKENPLKDFFGKNINVTAIVGENGSGKSSIAEILGLFTWDEDINNKSFLVFFNEKEFLFKKRNTGEKIFFTVVNNTKFNYKNTYIAREVFSIYFANEISTFLNKNKFINLKYYDEFDANCDKRAYFMTNNKLSITKEANLKYETFNKRFYELLKEDINIFDYINQKFIFDKFHHELHLYEFGAWIVDDYELLDKLNIKLRGNTIFEESIGDSNYESIFLKIIILFRLSFIKKSIKKEIKINDLKNRFSKKIINIDDYEYINNIIDGTSKDSVYDRKNIIEILERYQYVDGEIWIEKDYHEIKENIHYENKLLKVLIENFNRMNFFNSSDREYNYLSLSTGEKEYLNLLTNYIYNLKKLEDNKKFVFIFDEPDLGLHPSWQKRLVNDILYYANIHKYNKLQLIMSSHSPFILSDLPKQNVIFLEKDEKTGNCINASNKVDINPFGANIHTLLSHGFFMKNGLMGEFAKNKIDEVIKYLNTNQKSTITNDKEAQNIINIIGEPIIKKELQRMLKNKTELESHENVAKIQDEIEVLKKRIEELEKKKNNVSQ